MAREAGNVGPHRAEIAIGVISKEAIAVKFSRLLPPMNARTVTYIVSFTRAIEEVVAT
jgi:hypothetical protein